MLYDGDGDDTLATYGVSVQLTAVPGADAFALAATSSASAIADFNTGGGDTIDIGNTAAASPTNGRGLIAAMQKAG